MNLQNYYYYFKNALTPRFCDEIIKRGKKEQDHIALIGSKEFKPKKISKKEINDLKKWRNSNIAWLNDQWIYKEIHPYIHQANKSAGWNFDWDYSEACQFTKYGKNQFYDWHNDAFESPYENLNDKNFHGKIRKLSVTVSLSDPKDYKGGELEFDFRNGGKDVPSIKKCEEILPRGSIVVFPSFVWHRVTPVTKGVRYSLVIWSLGYPFK